jgi:broad specificity phosphatase PhoE
MELWLVRHGESTWNSIRRFQVNETGHLAAVPAEALAP